MGGDDTMQPATKNDTRLTYDDFLLFPDDGQRHELIDGEHYVTLSPNLRHQRISRKLCVAIAVHLQAHPIGEVFYAPLDVVVSEVDVIEPDLLYVSRERPKQLRHPREQRCRHRRSLGDRCRPAVNQL